MTVCIYWTRVAWVHKVTRCSLVLVTLGQRRSPPPPSALTLCSWALSLTMSDVYYIYAIMYVLWTVHCFNVLKCTHIDQHGSLNTYMLCLELRVWPRLRPQLKPQVTAVTIGCQILSLPWYKQCYKALQTTTIVRIIVILLLSSYQSTVKVTGVQPSSKWEQLDKGSLYIVEEFVYTPKRICKWSSWTPTMPTGLFIPYYRSPSGDKELTIGHNVMNYLQN